ncbi:unnamed protein product [Closterium sp. Naga37s-1]|nr:unnamed protein product [Closterium sp. Naga37s-1]
MRNDDWPRAIMAEILEVRGRHGESGAREKEACKVFSIPSPTFPALLPVLIALDQPPEAVGVEDLTHCLQQSPSFITTCCSSLESLITACHSSLTPPCLASLPQPPHTSLSCLPCPPPFCLPLPPSSLTFLSRLPLPPPPDLPEAVGKEELTHCLELRDLKGPLASNVSSHLYARFYPCLSHLPVTTTPQDLPSAVGEEDLTHCLELRDLKGRSAMVMPVCAYDGTGVREGVTWLVEATRKSQRADLIKQRADAAAAF